MRRDIIFRYSGLLVLILLAMLLGASHVAAQIPVGERPRSIAGGDFNEDGIPDLAVGNSKSSDVSILIGNGDGSFQPAVNFRTGELDNFPLGGNGTRSRGIAVGDYNEDGHQDLAFADAGDERDAVYFVSILLGNGDGTFGPSTDFGGFGGRPRAADTADMNEDGHLDLVVGNSTGDSVSVAFGDGNGGFTIVQTVAVQEFPISIAIADYDEDGVLDVANTNAGADSISVLLGDGTGLLGTPTFYTVGMSPYEVVAGDYNGDQNLDLTVANADSDDVSVLIGAGDGTFVLTGTIALGAQATPRAMEVGDLNNDGLLDLATANGGAGDTGEGLTLAAAAEGQGASVLLGDGAGSFTVLGPFSSSGGNPKGVVIADFNLDGCKDLAIANGGTDTVGILLGDCTGAMHLPGESVTIVTESLPDGQVGVTYSATLQASLGTPPYTWSISAGSLPAGLSLDGSTGEISGTPTSEGTSTFTVMVTDANSLSTTKELSIIVAGATSGGISGAVTDRNGAAVAGALVELFSLPSLSLVTSTTTDALGAYVLQGIAAGDYRVQARKQGVGRAKRDVTLAAGQPLTVNLTLK